MPDLPPGAGARAPLPNDMPGAGPAAMRGAPGVGGAPAFPAAEPAIPPPRRDVPETRSAAAGLIAFLDSTTPFVQAFDFLLMIAAGIFCLRARRSGGLTLLGICCFVSAVILLGFFLFGIFQGRGAVPQVAYITARLLAPFELLLFACAIILVARRTS